MSRSAADRERVFSQLFHATAEKYLLAHKVRNFDLIDTEGKAFLRSIDFSEDVFFDFIDDFTSMDGDWMLWYHKGAKEGDVASQSGLGYLYANGKEVAQDYALAAYWYGKAAEKGDVSAQTGLGYLHANGFGVAQDHVRAAHWYRQAAEKGSDYSQLQLGYLYQFGQGVERDEFQAMHWFRQAAGQGNLQAREELQRLEH